MTLNTRFYRRLALIGHIGLLVWMPLWYLFLADIPEHRSLSFQWFLAGLWTVPLLFPLPGILRGRPYTHAWANFIVMFYLLHGLTSLYAVKNEWHYALVEVLFSVAMFIGCSFFARMRGKELGLGIRKLKEEMAEEKQHFER